MPELWFCDETLRAKQSIFRRPSLLRLPLHHDVLEDNA
jgi:hypothetical protein